MLYALDANGRWVNAQLTEYRKYSQFFCGCAERHPVKLVKWSRDPAKREFTDHFAHIANSEHHDEAGRAVSSCGCTESPDHFNAKHKLREMVGRYTFTTFRCSYCRNTGSIDSGECEVIIEKTSKDRKWRYDCVLRSGDKDVAALEVLHSHKVTREKASSVRDTGLEIAEFRAEDILRLLADQPAGTVHLENLLMRHVKSCQKCVTQQAKMEMWFCWSEEISEIKDQEAQMYRHHQNAARCRELLAQRQRYLLQKDLAWRMSCWHDEVQELVVQEAKVATDSRNAARYAKLRTRQVFLQHCAQLPTHTPKDRRLRAYAERSTRWMARYASRHLRPARSTSNMPGFRGRRYEFTFDGQLI